MTFRPVRPGTPFRDVITSKLINDLTRQSSPPERLSGAKIDVGNRIEVLAQLDTNNNTPPIEPFDVVLLREPYQSYDPGNMVTNYAFKADPLSSYNETTHGHVVQWGIAQESIQEGVAGRVLLTGMSWLKKAQTGHPTSNLPFYRNIEIVNGQMIYGTFGRAEIVGGIGGTNTTHCVVHLSKRTNTVIMGSTTSAGIDANSQGDFTVTVPTGTTWTGLTPTLTLKAWNPHPTVNIKPNKRIVCVEYEGRWVVIFEACT